MYMTYIAELVAWKCYIDVLEVYFNFYIDKKVPIMTILFHDHKVDAFSQNGMLYDWGK